MKTTWVVAAAVLFVGASARAAEKPTAGFREHHAEVRVHLDHLDGMLTALPETKAEKQKQQMQFVVKFLNEHIRAHAEAEEKALYPVVDRYASKGMPFTGTMRYEHVIIGRWIDELAAESKKPSPDVQAFAKRGFNLLGLIGAHFEEEEEVLLTVLDAKMTRAQFEAEVASKMGGH